jgi:ElaB/YqjD/DUF883 family membrane-anchored ribosome-binding protein
MQGTNDPMDGGIAGGGAASGTGAASGLLTAPTSDSERFLADLKVFVTDAEALLSQARTLSGAGALAAREEFERRLAQARRQYAAAREVAVDRAHDYMDRTESYVRNEPWKAMGVAALAGAVVGVLLARR